MEHSRIGNLLVVAAAQLSFIAVSVIFGYQLSREVLIIPKEVLHLPDVYVSPSDMWSLARIFVTVYLCQIVLVNLIFGSHGFSSLRRFGTEYLFYLVAYTTASLYVFLATTINYSPQLIAAVGLMSTLFYLLAMVLVCLMRDGSGVMAAVGRPIWAIVRRLVSISGILALLYFLVPLVLGVAFTTDRDMANRITQIRIWFNPVPASEWGLKNLFPSLVFEQPMLVTQAPGDGKSLYVLERVGRVHRVPFPGGGEKELVLDIGDQLGEIELENGALGMAFHPQFGDFQGRQFVYLYYTDTRPEDGQVNRLSRFDLGVPEPAGRKESEVMLMELHRRDDGFHNGGSIEFGKDGYLYVGVGEGVHPADVYTSNRVLRAGILRIDVDEKSENLLPEPFLHGELQHYRVPADNPFVGNSDVRSEYWALGLRNPFRFTFDPKTNDLWLGDVGSTIWEEVNRIEGGKHYQFPMTEGRNPTGKSSPESLNIPEQGPVYTYQHNAYDRAVIGGIVYRGGTYPSLLGKYVFADNYSAKVFVMPADQSVVEEVDLVARARQYAQRGVSSVVQLESGEILVTTLGAASEPTGEVLLLVASDNADAIEEKDEATVVPTAYDEQASAASFAVNCARCHGVKGDGQGPDASMLGVKLPDMTSPLFLSKRSVEDMHTVIEKGGVALGLSPMMPPWGGFLQPEEINHLVTYIRSLPALHHQP